jgi:para-aminobenzoate synthetase component I
MSTFPGNNARKKAKNATEPLIFLDSQLGGHPSSGKSYVFTDFDVWITFRDGIAKLHRNSGTSEVIPYQDPWEALKWFRSTFPGYCAGYFGYDLKNYRETLSSSNPDDISLPEMWIGRPIFCGYTDENRDKVIPLWGQKDALFGTSIRLNLTEDGVSLQELFADGGTSDYKISALRSSFSKVAYMSQIEKAQARIREGDFYEINLSHQLAGDFEGSGAALFEHMREAGPVPFGSFMRLEGVEVCCASPERFLKKTGRDLVSEPIKGTRPRGRGDVEDEAIALELANSTKDRAENLMIVDLVRNDFNRVCLPGSVKVDKLFEIQRFGTVHQMVSQVRGTLNEGISTEEAIAACFPMGSMTGAPKIKAMEYIELLENYKRGLYSGAIGFISPDGDVNLNVVIRTAIIANGRIFYATGGAITSDSDPETEWEETLVKARALGNVVLDL